MILGVLYVDKSRKFRKNPRFWEKNISTIFEKFRKYFYRSGVTSRPPQIPLIYIRSFCGNYIRASSSSISTPVLDAPIWTPKLEHLVSKLLNKRLYFMRKFHNLSKISPNRCPQIKPRWSPVLETLDFCGIYYKMFGWASFRSIWGEVRAPL